MIEREIMRASCVSADLKRLLQQCPLLPCTVYGVYSKTFSLLSPGGSIISCVWQPGPLVPMGFCAAAPQNSHALQRGQQKLLCWGERHSQADIWFAPDIQEISLKLFPQHGIVTNDQKQAVQAVLNTNRPEGGMGDMLAGTVWDALRPLSKPPNAQRTQAGLQMEGFLNAAAAALPPERWPKVIGLGIGLTPAADDFILGMLAALRWRGHPAGEALARYTQLHWGGTTPVSSQMLRHGLQGEYPARLLAVFDQMGHPLRLRKALCQLGEHGHSSGMDMLYGVYHGLQWPE